MNVSLITLGDPTTLSGGYLYHRRMAEAASRYDAEMTFVSFPDAPFPLPIAVGRSVVGRALRSDVVVLDSIAAGYASAWLGRVPAGIPVVAMLHQTPGGIDHRRFRRWITARLDVAAYAKARKVLVASESLKAAVEEAGIATSRLLVVPPGRDVASSLVAAPRDLRASRRIAALCVANWIPRKGVLDALEAVAGLPEDLVTLHLAGSECRHTRYGKEVAARAGRSDLRGRVIRHGPLTREEVAALYESADVFLLPSFVEPYGTVFGEAMAHGLPVVGYRAGNLPFLAEHGKEAFMPAPGEIGELSRYLEDLANNEILRLNAGRAARQRAQSFPTWDETAALFFGSLKESLEECRKARHEPPIS